MVCSYHLSVTVLLRMIHPTNYLLLFFTLTELNCRQQLYTYLQLTPKLLVLFVLVKIIPVSIIVSWRLRQLLGLLQPLWKMTPNFLLHHSTVKRVVREVKLSLSIPGVEESYLGWLVFTYLLPPTGNRIPSGSHTKFWIIQNILTKNVLVWNIGSPLESKYSCFFPNVNLMTSVGVINGWHQGAQCSNGEPNGKA